MTFWVFQSYFGLTYFGGGKCSYSHVRGIPRSYYYQEHIIVYISPRWVIARSF